MLTAQRERRNQWQTLSRPIRCAVDEERIARLTARANDGMSAAIIDITCTVTSRGVRWGIVGGKAHTNWCATLEEAVAQAEEQVEDFDPYW